MINECRSLSRWGHFYAKRSLSYGARGMESLYRWGRDINVSRERRVLYASTRGHVTAVDPASRASLYVLCVHPCVKEMNVREAHLRVEKSNGMERNGASGV